MEAVPKLPLISFELKTSPENTLFGPKLKQYISEAYREDPDSYGNEMHQLEGLRSAAVRASIDSAGVSALIRYFCQLRALQSRFPMAKGQPAACSFTWKDLYANMSCTLPDIRFEMACILYNIGALYTQLGASEPRTTPDSLKAACQHYQTAAWVFQLMKEQYPQPPGADVSSEILRLLQEVCFAQAQECILEKSIQDTKKPSVIGAVATQVLYFYKNALAYLGPSTGTDNIHEIIGTKLYNYWHRYFSFKAAYIGCIVCLYQGIHTEEQQKMGERVAFYQLAVDKLAEARKLAKYIEPVQVTQEALTFTNDVVEGKRKAAKNENEFIYHEEVPDKDLLTDLKPVCLVKALSINFNDPEISGPDIFSRLVPMGAHEASSVYSEEKAKLLRHVVSQADAKNTELMEFMSSLQLDQLELLDSDQTIPQEIVDRCAAMNAKGEIIQTLVDSMNNLAEIISDVEHSLAEIKDIIQEETLSEKEYQRAMGPRPPSIVQTEMSREYHKYKEAHARTSDSNQVLHKAMTLHVANLRLLAQPLDQLKEKIPSIDNIEGLDRATMCEMRRVVGKAREMRTQRDALVRRLRDALAADDVTAQLLARPADPPDEIFAQEIEKHTPTVKIIEQNFAAQENIINKLTTLYAAYGESRRMLSDVIRKREGLINALVTSYDSHAELLGKSQKGLEFYRRLAHGTAQLLARLRSACQVQREERAQMLANQNTVPPAASPVPASTAAAKTVDALPTPTSGAPALKLKDYLPYMKNRNYGRSITPQAQIDPVTSDAYYPESIYPTSVRPTPVGSEAADLNPASMPDGGMMPPAIQGASNPYARYGSPYAPTEAMQSNYPYPTSTKSFDKPIPNDVHNYNYTSYTPPQYSSQMSDPQTYANPYYSATQNNTTIVTDSQNPAVYEASVSQANVNPNANLYSYHDQYGQNQMQNPMGQARDPAYGGVGQMNPPGNVPDQAYNTLSQVDLNASFAQMQVSGPKSEPVNYGGEYSQTYYSVQGQQYPNVAEAAMAYSNAGNGSNTTLMPSQLPSDYSNYSCSNDAVTQYGMQASVSNVYNAPEHRYAYTNAFDVTSQGYAYTNTDGMAASVNNAPATAMSVAQTYAVPSDTDTTYINPALAEMDAIDNPIKSHVTGQALSTINILPSYNPSMSYPPGQAVQGKQNADSTNIQNTQAPSSHYDQSNAQPVQQNNAPYQNVSDVNYAVAYQNHPGYTYNNATGTYEYTYGSQNSYSNYTNVPPGGVDPQGEKNPNWATPGVYTSAGTCVTVQSPSETPAEPGTEQSANNQVYYNLPYGYQTALNQSNELPPSTPVSTNYGANMNQSTYMQSGQGKESAVTFAGNQVESFPVTTPKENTANSNVEQQVGYVNQSTVPEAPTTSKTVEEEKPVVSKVEKKAEPSTFDLLSDIDFTVETKPLMPEIKVPQVSEKAIVKAPVTPKVETPKPLPKEEVIVRPPKRDIFSDPTLLNQFTQEVKNLQKLTDSLSTSTSSGVTLLDAKWKTLQDLQLKENMTRTKNVAMQYSSGNIATEVVPYDDSRLTLKSDPDAYINASYYKQLSPWCIPLVLSQIPEDHEAGLFWKAMLENKISCIVCLLSEIEMQGKSYWPTAMGQSLQFPGGPRVTLERATCTVHWSERRLALTAGAVTLHVTHYQINVFPAKIACSPLVLLADRVAGAVEAGAGGGGACVQGGAGGGRGGLLALLLLAMCEVRAGNARLCDILDAGCVNLYKQRTNVLEDKKYLADAYRTVLFYVQGVLCSGTTMFSGEAVSVPSGAGVLPPPPAAPPNANTSRNKFSRESFEEMKQSPGLKSGDMKDPLNFLDPLWSLKKK